MSASSTATRALPLRFWQTTVGKKVVMAVTGVILFGFLVGHMAGNLQFFLGAEKINDYAQFLHHSLGLLWGTRLVLGVSLILHIWAMVGLYKRSVRDARPEGYGKKSNRSRGLASVFMPISGALVAAFVVFHLLHFTTGHAHPEFKDLEPFHNLTTAFRSFGVALVYVAAMAFICVHLVHGLWSFTQSLGLGHPGHSARGKKIAVAVGVLIALGFAAIPIAVTLGLYPR